jgi:competence ComEA-like helix-hairpin-helix protein
MAVLMRKAALFGLLLIGSAGYAQVPDTTEAAVLRDLEMILEEVDEDSGIDAEQITQFLQDLAANPLDLNKASVEELMQIPGVTLRVASAIVAHRKKNGKFASVSELEKVKGVGAATRARMQPYVTVRTTRLEVAFDSRRMMRNAQTEMIVRYRTILEDQEGFTRPDSVTTRYLGTQSQQYQRLTFTSDQISFNLTQETDPGECSAAGFPFDAPCAAENRDASDARGGRFYGRFWAGLAHVLRRSGAEGPGSDRCRKPE